MSPVRWRGLLLLAGMVVELLAYPCQASPIDSHPFPRQKRQIPPNVSPPNGTPPNGIPGFVPLPNGTPSNGTPPNGTPPQLDPIIDNEKLKCFLLEDFCPPSSPAPPQDPSPHDPPPSHDLPPHDPPPPHDPQPHDPPSNGPPPPHDPQPHGPPPPHDPPPPPHDPQPHDPPPPQQSCICVPHWQCKDKKTTSAVTGNLLTSVVLDLRSAGCGAPEEVCCVDVQRHVPPPTLPPVTFSCGQRNILGVGNTFFGFKDQQTQFGEFPWTLTVISSDHYGPDSKPLFLSGGSLIHPQLVITVAHKLTEYSADKLMVRLGDWNLATQTEAVPHQEIRVAEVLIHPGYSGDPYHYYDLALLVLERPAVIGPTVNTICLPIHEHDYLHEKCVVTGWGKKNFHDLEKYQKVMKAVSMPLVSHDTCRPALQQTRLGPDFLLHDSFRCAGGHVEGQDACTGDGGSPLVCPLRSDPSRYVQVGVVSWGIGCGRLGVPGVYADVLKEGLWIDRVLNERFGSSRQQMSSQKPMLDLRIG